MEELFGLQMSTLAIILVIILAVLVIAVGFYAFQNRFLVKLALRNIPRRRNQTVLIIFGLMLSTAIIAASLSIGDTIAVSIRDTVLEAVGNTDITVEKPNLGPFGEDTLSAQEIQDVADELYDDERIDGFMPIAFQTLPILNQRTSLTQARAVIAGYDLDGFNGDFRPQSQGGPSPQSRLSPFLLNPTADGQDIGLSDLQPNQILVNEFLAEEIDAQKNDTVTIVTVNGRVDLQILDIVQTGGIAANDQRALMTLDAYHAVMQSDPTTADRIDISVDLDNYDIDDISEEIVDELRIRFTDPEIARELHSGIKQVESVIPALEAYVEKETVTGGALNDDAADDIRELIQELKNDQPSERFRALIAEDTIVGHFIQATVNSEDTAVLQALAPLTLLIDQIETLSTTGLKAFLLELADLIGNIFVTFFTFFGSFSVIVGLLLIFLIFVLLASERQQEMGIARAVGTKRGHLIQMFTFEGLAYAFGAAAVGIIIGVIAGRILVGLMASAFGTDSDQGFSIIFSVTPYSIISAFCIGLILTLVTVVFSAYRVSRLNIVVAIRNLPEEFVASTTAPILQRLANFVFWIFGPIYTLVMLIKAIRDKEDAGIAALKFVLTLLIVGWIIGIIASFVRIISPYIANGWPLAVAGAALTALGFANDTAWQAYVGASLAVYGIGITVRWLAIRSGVRESIASRIVYSIVGILILIMWATPQRFAPDFIDDLNGDIEMFILAGVWMVASAVWVVMYNSDIIVQGLQSTLGRFNALRPILKPAIAYAVANRFRTGLTVAMFALVIFVMMAFSILNSSFSALVSAPETLTGGFDIRAEINADLPIQDISDRIEQAPELRSQDFQLIAGMSDQIAQARQIDGTEPRYLTLVIRGSEPQQYSTTQLNIQDADHSFLPQGVDTEDQDAVASAVWNAIANDPSLAVITSEHIAGTQDFGPAGLSGLLELEDTENDDGDFVAKEIEIALYGATDLELTATRTVIAVVDDNADGLENSELQAEGDGGPASGFAGIYTRHQIFDEISPEPVPFNIYKIKLAPNADPSRISATMETVFLDHSMVATDTEDEVQIAVSQNDQFSLLFQGFMGLGLIVGVASLGVLSLRAVNERRLQIAIMRAIGYRSSLIRAQFIMESIFITIIGTGLGVALGSLISWTFIDDISDQAQGLQFTVPWLTVTVILAITIAAALLTTYLPANQASKIYPAEALRYE